MKSCVSSEGESRTGLLTEMLGWAVVGVSKDVMGEACGMQASLTNDRHNVKRASVEMSTCKIQDNRIGDGGDWIHLAWDRDTFRAVHTVMNVRYAEARNLWTSSATVSFPNTVLQGVFRFYFRNIFCDLFNGTVAKDYCKTSSCLCVLIVCPDCVLIVCLGTK